MREADAQCWGLDQASVDKKLTWFLSLYGSNKFIIADDFQSAPLSAFLGGFIKRLREKPDIIDVEEFVRQKAREIVDEIERAQKDTFNKKLVATVKKLLAVTQTISNRELKQECIEMLEREIVPYVEREVFDKFLKVQNSKLEQKCVEQMKNGEISFALVADCLTMEFVMIVLSCMILVYENTVVPQSFDPSISR